MSSSNIASEYERNPLMKSKIDIIEFRNRLKENTKIGLPSLKIQLGILSTFADNSQCFYGTFDKSTFELIINSNYSPSFYLLRGSYKKTEKNLIVNYNLEPIDKLRVYWVKYFPFIALIFCNSIFYFEVEPPLELYVIFNVIIIFISFLIRPIIKWQNRKLKLKFNKIFEIIE